MKIHTVNTALVNCAQVFAITVLMFLLSFFILSHRLQDTPLHTPRLTVDGMKPLAGLKAARPQGLPLVHECGTPLLATHQLALLPLAGTRLVMPHLAMVEPQVVFARTDGTKLQRQTGRHLDMGAGGLKPHVQTGEMSQWVRLQPQGPVKGNLGGTKPLLVRWGHPHHCLLLAKLQ